MNKHCSTGAAVAAAITLRRQNPRQNTSNTHGLPANSTQTSSHFVQHPAPPRGARFSFVLTLGIQNFGHQGAHDLLRPDQSQEHPSHVDVQPHLQRVPHAQLRVVDLGERPQVPPTLRFQGVPPRPAISPRLCTSVVVIEDT